MAQSGVQLINVLFAVIGRAKWMESLSTPLDVDSTGINVEYTNDSQPLE